MTPEERKEEILQRWSDMWLREEKRHKEKMQQIKRQGFWMSALAVAAFPITALIVFCISLLFPGCTPHAGLAHQYHIAAITINGERTETDFLLTKMENDNEHYCN